MVGLLKVVGKFQANYKKIVIIQSRSEVIGKMWSYLQNEWLKIFRPKVEINSRILQ